MFLYIYVYIYLSRPDGISLNNTAEVCAYLRTRYPNAAASKSYEDLVASRFVFEPTTDAPSLDNGLNFIAPVQSSASEEPPNVTSTSVSCGSKYSCKQNIIHQVISSNHISRSFHHYRYKIEVYKWLEFMR